ncbi:hypothetical protein V7024_19850 [Bacillus sp. JJ864]|uniref:hypothetical protein n=1 Tax=Bacillus sp. JJ864 TaxID=3122975 RepID=UPI002FFE60C1
MNNKCKECGATSNLEYNAGICYLCGHDNKQYKKKIPYCVNCNEEYKGKDIPDYYCEKCDMYTVMHK